MNGVKSLNAIKLWFCSILIFPFFSVFSSSCRSLKTDLSSYVDSEKPQNLDPEMKKNLDFLSRQLGSGFDGFTQRKLQTCMNVKSLTYAGAQSSTVNILEDRSATYLLNELGGAVYAKASLFGLVSGKVQGDMATALATTDDTSSLIYHYAATGKMALIEDREFNAIGSAAYARNDLRFFREQCGDQFVERVRLGAQLYIGMKYVFTSKEQKEKIRLTLKGELFWGLIKFSKTWSKEWRDMLANVRVSIEAFQVGGNPKRLEELKSHIFQGSCAGNDADRCSEAIDGLLAYAKDEFPKQLNNMEISEDSTKGPAILYAITSNYADRSVYDPIQQKRIQVSLPPKSTSDTDLATLLTRIANLRMDLKIALSRSIGLLDFQLTTNERSTVLSAKSELTSLLTSLDASANGSCKAALNDEEWVSVCSSEVGLLVADIARATKPLEISTQL